MAYAHVANTADPTWNLMHDAARPYAVIEVSSQTGSVLRTHSRHETRRGALIAAGKRNKSSDLGELE